MPRLVITASPLIGRWSLTSATRRDRISWPPSPDTLFSALVASAASLGNPCHPALYWLESLGNPTIEAAAQPPRVEMVQAFSPVADRTMWEKGARQARWHNSIGDAGPVSWSWDISDTTHIAELARIVGEIAYIGSSRGPVLASLAVTEAPPSDEAMVQHEAGGEHIRGLYPGRLAELEAAYQAGVRPIPTQTVRYARLSEIRLESPWGQLIPLRRTDGQPLFVTESVRVTEAVRQAIMRHLPKSAAGILTGHATDGATLRDFHMAVVPLPRVGDRFADGELLGAGLMLPRALGDADYDALIGALGEWLAAGGTVDLGEIRWTMDIAHDDPRMSLRPTRFNGSAHVWTSVTPIVFDRHPRRTLSLADAVAAMCRDVGLPAPSRVEATPEGWLTGSSKAWQHRLGQRDYLARHHIAHLRIEWPRRVPGPIALGRGRYFGLGVMLPWQEAA